MFKIDAHTHTVASGHAYSTLIENARAAKEKGLEILGTSDHAPKLPGSAYLFFINNLRILPDYIEGVRVLKGIEADIINYRGDIDLTSTDVAHLDYVIASLHIPVINPGTKADNTAAVIGAMKNPAVKIIGHPDDARYPKDFEEIVRAAKHYNKVLEVNNTSLNPRGVRENAKDTILHYLDICAREGVPIMCNSDAHFAYDIGNFTYCQEVIEASGFPSELILNNNTEEFLAYIRS